MEGPFSSTLLVGAVSYRLSHKWIMDLAGTYDLGPTGNIGERLAITRVGESMLVRFTLQCGFRPRQCRCGALRSNRGFMPKGRLGRVAGVPDPAGRHDGNRIAFASGLSDRLKVQSWQDTSTSARRTRSWARKFGDALRGCGIAIRRQHSFWVHAVCAVAVLLAGACVPLAALAVVRRARSVSSPCSWPRCSTRRSKQLAKAVDRRLQSPHPRCPRYGQRGSVVGGRWEP